MAGRKQQQSQESPEARVQATVDQETEQGFRGQKVDPTPNENYTVAGVTSQAATPETDSGAADQAAARQQQLAADPFADNSK